MPNEVESVRRSSVWYKTCIHVAATRQVNGSDRENTRVNVSVRSVRPFSPADNVRFHLSPSHLTKKIDGRWHIRRVDGVGSHHSHQLTTDMRARQKKVTIGRLVDRYEQ